MSALPPRFTEDRALRDAARAVVTEDLTRLRAHLGEQGIASRVSSGVKTTVTARIRSGARDVLAQAKAQAGDHKGVLAVLIGAIILFLARGPILDWLDGLDAPDAIDNDTDETSAAASPEAASEGDPA